MDNTAVKSHKGVIRKALTLKGTQAFRAANIQEFMWLLTRNGYVTQT
jgi:hypothetical protein